MELEYIFFHELELYDEHKFALDFQKNDIGKQIHFSCRKKYFITQSKAFVEKEKYIKKWNDYEKIVELSNFCQKLVAEDERDIGLKEIEFVSDKKDIISRIASYK